MYQSNETTKKHAHVLRALMTTSPAVTKAIIRSSDRDLVNTLCECCFNVLKGNVQLTSSQKKKLQRHKNTLRQLSNKKHSLKRKRHLLQKGGFLGALLGPVIGILGTLLRQ